MSVLAIAGFHRSGTSMATELLVRGGLFVGEDLIGANSSNPYGHFEDREIVRLHDDLLADMGLDWQVTGTVGPVVSASGWQRMARIADVNRARHRRWGFKDPRNCFFLGPWKHIVPDMKVLVVYRDPRECADSLARRHADQWVRRSGPSEVHLQFWRRPDLALRMWVAHNRVLVDWARAHREDTLVVPHRLIADGYPLVGAVNAVLGTGLDRVDTREVFDPRVAREATEPMAVSSREVVDDVLDVWADLEDLAEEDAIRHEEAHGALG